MAMALDVVQLTKDLVAIDSVSARSDEAVAVLLEEVLRGRGFEVERLEYHDPNGELKVSVVGRKGEGTGGLAYFSHFDTVPGTGWDRDPWQPIVEDGRLIGLGSCDMKGPLAATVVAADMFDASQLARPVLIVATADEEVSGQGARQVVAESKLFNESRPPYGVVAEPTRLIPVYAHKGGGSISVTATGFAAHTSTGRGISANFLIAPFLAEMAELAQRLKDDPSYQNSEFDPPTVGFNMTLDDGGCRPNVTAARTVCTLGIRPMPGDRSGEVIAEITERAARYGFELTSTIFAPFHVAPDATVVRVACEATGVATPRTVPYGTDAYFYQDAIEAVILGPGDIAQAHTNGEWIELDQLHEAANVYARMIARLCQ
jgi:acetylornithine deacetylase